MTNVIFNIISKLCVMFVVTASFLYADSESVNNTNPGEVISGLDGANYSYTAILTGRLTQTEDSVDYYKFTVTAPGNVQISSATTSETFYFDVSKTAWEGNEIYDGSSSSSYTTSNFSVSANQTIYIKMARNKTFDYNLTINYSATPPTGFTCANPRNFAAQASYNLFGDTRIIGNTNMCYNNNGVCGDPGIARNNDINMMYSDPDGSLNTTTFNSSSAKLDLPDGATVRWAKLYWQGYLVDENDSVKTSSKSIKFAKPGQGYQTIDSTQSGYNYNWIYFTGSRYYYQGSADITSLVQSGGEGNYTVANIVSEQGKPIGGSYAAWSLVVIYDDENATLKNVTVFDGYKGVVTSGDQTSALAYATDNGCSTDTGALNSMTIPLSGFLTPKEGTVNSTLSIFAGEGDKGVTGDFLELSDKNGVYHHIANNLKPYNDIFNSTITYSGATVSDTTSPVAITPYYSSNSNGSDIDSFDVSHDYLGNTLIGNNQTSSNVRLSTVGDGYMPGVFAFSTELYTPNFCYDYGYEQNGRPFTEDNNGTAMPYISGFLPNTADINVSIYVRNQENSDIKANNVRMDITGIDTAQAIYIRNSVAVTYGNTFTPTTVTDSSLIVSDGSVRNIPLGNIGGTEYAYMYYGVKPNSTGNINIPIIGTFYYDLIIPLPDGTSLRFPYSSRVGGSKLPMCSTNNFSYTPQWGIFSMVDGGLYDSLDVNKRYYDLTTQVVRRPGNLRIASFDPVALDTPKSVSTNVAVEMIDVSQFHDIDAACREPSSAITPRIWMAFDGNVSQVDFNATVINEAITNGTVSDSITTGATSLTTAEDFYNTATPNASYRVTFNVTNDGNGSLIQTAPGTQTGNTQILNFTQLVQDIQYCSKPVEMPSNPGSTTHLVSVACGNAGNQGIDKHNMAICMECLYGYNTQVMCSRDNFAIRPESYTIAIKDSTTDIAPNHTGVSAASLNTDQVKMSAGYSYNYELTATNHQNNMATKGYTRYFGTADNEYNVSLLWNSVKTGCNDTNNRTQRFNMINGNVVDDANHSQVGEYLLNMIDKTWTQVDWNPIYQVHQTGSHFLSGGECILNSTYVPSDTSVVSLSGGVMNNLVGCDINSTHNNIQAMLAYRDYNIAFRPDTFDLSGIRMSTGSDFNGSVMNANAWTYMNTVNETPEMGVRYSGQIRAVGDNNETLSNFVTDCYAEPLKLDMSLIYPTTAGLPNWRYRLQEVNASNGELWRDTNAVIASPATNTAFPILTLPQNSFLKNQNWMVDLNLTINYDRNQTIPVNPIEVGLRDYQISCETDLNCNSIAHGDMNHLPDQKIDSNNTTTFVYGRLLTRDVRVFGQNSFNANGWYEVFNLPSFAGGMFQPSKNGANWFINNRHDDLSHGDANVTRMVSATAANMVNYGGNDALGVETFSFPAIAPTYNGKAHVDTAPWLWHGPNALTYSDPSVANPANAAGNDAACLTHPCFNVTVMPAIGATGSAKSTNEDNKGSKSSTRGNGWHSTSDYAPAIR